jgi:enoyl-CoA hydratase/carnithine racemase
MILTGEWLPAAELYRLGAAEAVVPPEELLPTTMALAKLITSKSPIGVHLAKESANRVEFAERMSRSLLKIGDGPICCYATSSVSRWGVTASA